MGHPFVHPVVHAMRHTMVECAPRSDTWIMLWSCHEVMPHGVRRPGILHRASHGAPHCTSHGAYNGSVRPTE